jgi:hypothetical protein
MGFREIVDFLIPAHFTEGEGGLKLLSFTTLIDASVERVRLGLEARFPSRAGDSALALIGQDRGIPRGRTEASAHYAARLKRWRWPRGHRTRGTAYALLEQVSEYFGGTAARVTTIRGRNYDRSASGEESWNTGTPFDWDGAATLPNWGRFWLKVAPSSAGAMLRITIDYVGSTEGTIGLTGFAPDDARAMRNLLTSPHPWKPAGVRGEWLIFGSDFAAATPDGRWGRWSYISFGGTQAASRYASWRYVSLDPERNNRYAGDPARFCLDAIFGGSFYGGDPTSFPASAVLPNGSGYAGDPSSFPLSVLLLDDGDAP